MITTTWDDIRVSSLQKMFLITGSEVEENDSTKPYLAAMPYAYNEAIRLLATTNRYIIKQIEIPTDGTSKILLDTKKDVDDLFKMASDGVYFASNDGYKPVYNYDSIANTLILPEQNTEGRYIVYYYAYPKVVTSQTEGNTDLEIDPDVASLIPLYIASELYKEDDISIATVYRNEFELGRELLIKEPSSASNGKINCTTGWW